MTLALLRKNSGGFLLSEMMISMIIFAAISLGLLMGFTALERNYTATSDFALNHADQMRISDYLALDLRRALSLDAAQNDTTIYIPSYYDQSGQATDARSRWQRRCLLRSSGQLGQRALLPLGRHDLPSAKWRHARRPRDQRAGFHLQRDRLGQGGFHSNYFQSDLPFGARVVGRDCGHGIL